jgi:hypothetical protein
MRCNDWRTYASGSLSYSVLSPNFYVKLVSGDGSANQDRSSGNTREVSFRISDDHLKLPTVKGNFNIELVVLAEIDAKAR